VTGGLIGETLDFAKMAKTRMIALVDDWNDLIRKKKPPFTLPATVRFVRFNFDTNAVSTIDHVFDNKTTGPSLKDSDWTVVPAGSGVDISTHDNNPTLAAIVAATGAVRKSNVVTITTTAAHHLKTGDSASTSGVDEDSFNDSFTIASVPAPRKFTFAQTGADDTSGNGGVFTVHKTLSITNIYNTVRQCPDDSVLEVSIFSHAYVFGPVLINTSDTSTTTDRDPKDMDGRPKDFNSDMGDSTTPNALKEFIKKFDKTGHFRVYGCNAQDVLRAVTIVTNVVAATGAVRKSNVITFTTTAAHGLQKGADVSVSDVGDASFNGPFTIEDVPSTKTFTVKKDGPDATSGSGIVFTSGGTTYKRSGAFQVIDQAFRQPLKTVQGADLRKGKAPTAPVVLEMWDEVMNEAEADVGPAAWPTTPTKVRNRLANALLIMHRQLDPDFYPAPNATDSTAAPVPQTVTKAWADVLRVCAKKLTESYIFKAADKLNVKGITCHGAVPGVGGNNETDTRELGLMRVCVSSDPKDGKPPHFGCDHGYAEWLLFYRLFIFVDSAGKQVAGFDDRNFAQLDQTTVPIVRALAGP
jgi:hypothetical protein